MPDRSSTETDLCSAICEAIHAQKLAVFLSASEQGEWSEEEQSLLSRARASQSAIIADTLDLRDVIEKSLRIKGVTSFDIVDAARARSAQFQRVEIKLDASQVHAGFQAASDCGFELAGLLSPGAVAALARWEHRLEFVRQDDVYSRLSVSWSDQASKPTAPGFLRPRMEDYAFLDLPKALWPFYSGMKVLRKAASSFPRASATAANFIAQKSLGTPKALLRPLIEFAQISEDDHLIDVGCGDGRFLIEAVLETGCHGTGIEMDASCAKLAAENVSGAGLNGKLEIIQGKATAEMLAPATTIFTFQPPAIQKELIPFILKARPKGARLLVHEQFRLADVPLPSISRPVFGRNALTVGHIWAPA